MNAQRIEEGEITAPKIIAMFGLWLIPIALLAGAGYSLGKAFGAW